MDCSRESMIFIVLRLQEIASNGRRTRSDQILLMHDAIDAIERTCDFPHSTFDKSIPRGAWVLNVTNFVNPRLRASVSTTSDAVFLFPVPSKMSPNVYRLILTEKLFSCCRSPTIRTIQHFPPRNTHLRAQPF